MLRDKENGNLVMCKSSWHYRLVMFIFTDYFIFQDRVNLCPYMRRVIISIFLFPFVGGWEFVPDSIRIHKDICQFLSIFVLLVLSFSSLLSYWYPDTPYYVFAGVGLIGGFAFIGFVAGIIIGGCAIKDKWDDRPRHYNEHKTTGLVKAYVGAKHDKVCPSIKFCDAPEYDKNGTRHKQDGDCP